MISDQRFYKIIYKSDNYIRRFAILGPPESGKTDSEFIRRNNLEKLFYYFFFQILMKIRR